MADVFSRKFTTEGGGEVAVCGSGSGISSPFSLKAQIAEIEAAFVEIFAKFGFENPVIGSGNQRYGMVPGVRSIKRVPLTSLNCGPAKRHYMAWPFAVWETIVDDFRYLSVEITPSPAWREKFAGLFDSVHIVERRDYMKMQRFKRRAQRYRSSLHYNNEPILHEAALETLKANTLAFVSRGNLRRAEAYGCALKRGILLSGPPGNGKTMACRWLRDMATSQGLIVSTVSISAFREAMRLGPDAVADLFKNSQSHCLGRPIGSLVFFDDMDIAMRNRDMGESDAQLVFLQALDGMTVLQGAAFVFTTNIKIDEIDPAFRRPGRIDVILEFNEPDEELRRRFIETWHPDVVRAIDVSTAVQETEGMSFAEMGEVRHLLSHAAAFDREISWDKAMAEFSVNRTEFINRQRRRLGYTSL